MSELVLKHNLQRALDERLIDLRLSILSKQPIAFLADQAASILKDYKQQGPGTGIECSGEKLLSPNAHEQFQKTGQIVWALFADAQGRMSEAREALWEVFVALATFAWRTPTKTTMSSLEGKLSHYLELRRLTDVVEAECLPPVKTTVMHELIGIEAKVFSAVWDAYPDAIHRDGIIESAWGPDAAIQDASAEKAIRTTCKSLESHYDRFRLVLVWNANAKTVLMRCEGWNPHNRRTNE